MRRASSGSDQLFQRRHRYDDKTVASTGRPREKDRLNDFGRLVDVDRRLVALAFDTAFTGFVLAQQIERDVTHDAQYFSAVVTAGAAFVFAKAHIEHPMQPVLYSPVVSYRMGELLRIGCQGGE
jgi:hypothetical protein